MDWNDLRNQVSNISLYDIKAGVRKVQNAVMNYTEMESKVREATNNEPWGASSSLMQEIANGTFNYQLLNEIMPMIYKRFTEKSAEEWRQIYKALQLMEFLVKNGSERVIDDARSHLSLLKMLRQFHFIDQNGKDQGINVRNRSKELADLLSDVEKIRAERKKARATRNKYGGVEGGAGLGPSGASSSRYGGFGSETGGYGPGYGGATRNVYGDGGGFGGEDNGNDDYEEDSASAHRNTERFEEYNEFDDGGAQAPPSRRRRAQSGSTKKASQKKPEPAKPKEPEVDLFDFGDDDATTSTSASAFTQQTSVLAAPASAAPIATEEDDDFDDFQSATPAAPVPAQAAAPTIPAPNYSSFSTATPTQFTQFAQPSPQVGAQQANFSNLFATTSPAPAAAGKQSAFPTPAQPKPAAGYQPTGPNYYTSVQVQPTAEQAASMGRPGLASPTASIGAAAAKKPAGQDAFASLLSGSGVKSGNKSAQKGLSLADMAKQKSQAGLYGANAGVASGQNSNNARPTGNIQSNGLNDLLG